MLNELNALKELLNPKQQFLIVSHKSPDGDAIGSGVAFFWLLKNLGLDAALCFPDKPSDSILPFASSCPVIYFSEAPESAREVFNHASVLICLDFNGPSRVGEMQPLIDGFTGVKVMIDHHPSPESFADIMISDVANSSTCQLIFECIEGMGLTHAIDQHVAKALYLGILTDTGSFRFPSVTPKTHEILAFLMKTGIHHWQIHQDVFDNNRLEQLQLKGFAISEKLTLLIDKGLPFGFIALTKEDLVKYNYRTGDTEGLVNTILSIEGIKAAVLIQERELGIKMSFRSKDEVYVNDLAKQHFNGGGHKYAAGGVSFDNMEVTISKLLSLIPILF